MLRPRFIGLLLALITLLVYLPVAHDDFLVYDDHDYVTENSVVQNGLTWAGIKWAFTTGHASNWHPITWLSHMADCELFGLNPGAHHLVNVLFHTANAVLLLLLLFRLTGALWPSAFIAALFAWHPLHVESVAWISERKDVLSTFFALLTLLAYVRYARNPEVGSQKSETEGNRFPTSVLGLPASGFYWLALFFFALGLMSKPMLVTLPFVMLLLDYWPLRRIPNFEFRISNAFRLVFEKWPFFVLVAASCIVTVFAQYSGGSVVPLELVPLRYRLANAVTSYLDYFLKMFWPVNLAVLYPTAPLLRTQFFAATVFLIVVSCYVWKTRRMRPYLLVGWLWFLGTLVPVIGLVQVGNQAMADRYTYVPLVGVFIAISFGIKDLIARFQIGIIPPAVAASLILGSCLVLTEQQLSYWKNSEILFRHALAVTKNNGAACINLGVALEGQGFQAEALSQYQEALRINFRSVEAHNNLGNLLSDMGKTNEALVQYQEALKLNPRAPLAHDNLGTLLVKLSRFDEAISQYEQAAQLDPGDFRPHYLMGKALLKQGRDAEAIGKFREALQLNPNDFQTLAFLARGLALSENPQIRNGAEAVALAEKANDLTGGEHPLVLDILAMSYAEVGRFKDAQQIEQQAIQLAQAAGLKETNIMNRRLELYESSRPYRETSTNLPPRNLPKN
jgi:tetratricopeptide (TPR) repeat protein